jgi:translation elongation factor EF-4
LATSYYRETDVVKVEIPINQGPVDMLAFLGQSRPFFAHPHEGYQANLEWWDGI